MASPNKPEDPKAEGTKDGEEEKPQMAAERPIERPSSPPGQSSPRPGIPDSMINMVGASPPRFVNFDQLMAAADGMKNMELAHEIAVNNDFELEQEMDTSNSLEKQVRETVKRAFWDAFQDRLSRDPPDLSMAAGMLKELKESLLGIMLPQHKRLKEQIQEVLDLSLISQQMDNGAMDFEFYGSYVTDIMAKLCAPARDDSITEIKQIKEVTPKFRAIMETLELMRRDMANFTIKQVRPYIQQNSIEYEIKKFTEYFEAQRALGINALQYTEIWVKRSFDKLKQTPLATQTPGGSQALAPTPANILTQAYVEILEWSDPLNFPETLQMDQKRLMALRDKLHMLGLITSVQLITYSVGGAPVEGVEALKLQLKEHCDVLLRDVATRGINDVLSSIAEQVITDVDASLRSRQMATLSDDQKTNIRGQVASLGGRENRIRQIMLNRLVGFVHEGISGKPVNSLQIPKGCSAVQQELSQVLGNFLRLTSHNRSVFGSNYAGIIEGLLSGPEDGAQPPQTAA